MKRRASAAAAAAAAAHGDDRHNDAVAAAAVAAADEALGGAKRPRRGAAAVAAAAPPAAAAAQAAIAQRSTVEVDADVVRLHARFLGRRLALERAGVTEIKKNAVAALANVSLRNCPRFNRLSGVVEFRNAIALFVNVQSNANGGGGGKYDNVFAVTADADGNEACAFSWYASPKHHAESPLIKRLLAGKTRTVLLVRSLDRDLPGDGDDDGAGGGSGGGGGGRDVGAIDDALDGQYVDCGDLEQIDVDLDARPIRFAFRLVAWASVLAHSAATMRFLQCRRV